MQADRGIPGVGSQSQLLSGAQSDWIAFIHGVRLKARVQLLGSPSRIEQGSEGWRALLTVHWRFVIPSFEVVAKDNEKVLSFLWVLLLKASLLSAPFLPPPPLLPLPSSSPFSSLSSLPPSFPSLLPLSPSLSHSLLYLLYNKYASQFWLHFKVRCFAVFHTRAKNRPKHLSLMSRGCILLLCLNNSLVPFRHQALVSSMVPGQ